MRGGICPGCGSGKGIRRGAAKERKKSGSRSSGKGILWLVLAVVVLCGMVIGTSFKDRGELPLEEEDTDMSGDSGFSGGEQEYYFDGSLVTEDPTAYGEPLTGSGGLFGGRPVLPYQPEVDPESYHPDPEDDFYRCLANAQAEEGLGYSVTWEPVEIALENGAEKGTFEIPRVEMEDTELAGRMNSEIREMILPEDLKGEYLPQISFYVTCMSEERFSAVLKLGIPDPSTQQEYAGVTYMEYPKLLRTLNYDLQTGERLSNGDMLAVTPAMASRFWSLCCWQNPNHSMLDTCADLGIEGLAEKLSGEEGIFFYTPVGLEIGFRDERGYITATMNREHSLPFYRYFLEEPDYEPSPEDAYYKRLVNAVREDLSYQVEFQVHNYEDETGRYYFYYPQLAGGEIPNLEEINARIREAAWIYGEEPFLGAPSGVETISYVTYMDEEVISIVVCEYTYILNLEGIWEGPGRLYSVTFDLAEGKEIPKLEILDMDADFAARFLKLLEEQEEKNPRRSSMDLETPESIYRFYFTDDWNNLVFYTPVGIEAGFNRIGYYLTVTVKQSQEDERNENENMYFRRTFGALPASSCRLQGRLRERREAAGGRRDFKGGPGSVRRELSSGYGSG